jgi:hypothetical protein
VATTGSLTDSGLRAAAAGAADTALRIHGTVNAYFSFDVAESIDLGRLRESLGPSASLATLYDKAPGAPRVRYIQPPVVVDGAWSRSARI